MYMNRQRWIAVGLGITSGILSTHVLLIGWGNVIFWGLMGVTLGYFVIGKREVICNGALFGFFLSISFLFSGFQGASDKFLPFTLFSLALSIVGIGGGTASVFIGGWLREKYNKSK